MASVDENGLKRGFSLSFPRRSPLARFVDPDLAARIQDGDFLTNSGFFDHPTADEITTECCETNQFLCGAKKYGERRANFEPGEFLIEKSVMW